MDKENKIEELKLRAWLTEDKVMLPVESISFHWGHMDIVMPPDKRVTKVSQDSKVMLWTGLRDKHGKEIYEGDIIKFFDCNDDVYVTPVVWYKECACFGVQFGDGAIPTEFPYLEEWYCELNKLEVIGNIYEGVDYGG